MKNILYVIGALAILASCTKDDDEVNFTVSQAELLFTAEESEQEVSVTADADWNVEYNADWLLVRQQQNKIRVIASANTTATPRETSVKITVGGSSQKVINVKQEGTQISVESDAVTARSLGEDITVSVQSNVTWSIDCDIDWCTVQKNGNNLSLIVSRNYTMEARSGIITLKSGEVSQVITVTQPGCEWFESFEMVDVQGGTFLMGAQKTNASGQNYDAEAYQIESPVHSVTIGNYAIGMFEVTQAQWFAAMGSNPSSIQGDNLPVENVTWEEVQEFITLLNQQSGLNYRLPTEAEWEFAAKGGNQSDGFKYSGYSILGACGWYYTNSEATTHPVGTKNANELGLFDMSGNVREWCNDWFDYYDSSSVENPQGPSYGSMKVNRGGSWTTPDVNCRNTYRHTDAPYDKAQDLGFRLALTK